MEEEEESCALEWLPEEVRLQILSYLNFRDLSQVALLSSSWNLLAEDDALWRELRSTSEMSDDTLHFLLTKHPFIASFKWRPDITCGITEVGLTQLCVQCSTSLTHLCLESCDEVTSELIGIISQYCLVLTYLDISANPSVDDLAMVQLSYSRSLTALRIANCDRITDGGLEVLLRSRPLTQLDTSFLLDIRHRTIENLVVYSATSLTALWLDGGNLTDNDITKLAGLPLLKYLEIQYCDELGDEGLQYLARLTHLRKLKLARCFSLSSYCLDAMLASFNHLRELVLIDCSELDDMGLIAIGRHSHSLDSLVLSQSYRHTLTDVGVGAIISGCSSLRSLTLRGLKAVRTFVSLIPVLRLRHLRILHLGGCQNIPTFLLETVAAFCPSLTIYGNYANRIKPRLPCVEGE